MLLKMFFCIFLKIVFLLKTKVYKKLFLFYFKKKNFLLIYFFTVFVILRGCFFINEIFYFRKGKNYF